MASGRILTTNVITIVLISFIMVGCGTTSNTSKKPIPPPSTEKEKDVNKELANTLDETRSELDDAYPNDSKTPEYFLKDSSSSGNRNIGNPYTGYRVQIISTRNKAAADSLAGSFRVWADDHLVGYFPQVYVTFDQPYYKVHVGNFQFQQRASHFTQLLKSKFPGAWVVHDRIEPKGVPRHKIRVVQ